MSESRQPTRRNLFSGSMSPTRGTMDDDFSKLSLSGQQSQVKFSETKITGAVSKRYKTRHPTDPFPSATQEGRQKSPCPPVTVDKRKHLSSSDSHLLKGSTPRITGSSSGSSPTSNPPLTPGRQKSSSMYGSSGGLPVVFPSNLDISELTNDAKLASKTTTPDTVSNGKSPSITKLNKGQRTPKKEKTFESYMMLNDVQQGMKKGELLEGVLRINPKNFQDAYISVPGERTDIYLGGILDRNRALNGDVVVVKLKPKEEWKILTSDLRNYLIRNNITEGAYLTTQNKKNFIKNKPVERPCVDTITEVVTKEKKHVRRGKRGKKKKGGPLLNDAIENPFDSPTSENAGDVARISQEVHPAKIKRNNKKKVQKTQFKNQKMVQETNDFKCETVSTLEKGFFQTYTVNHAVPYESDICQITNSIDHANCSTHSSSVEAARDASPSSFPVIDDFVSSNLTFASNSGSYLEHNAKLADDVEKDASTGVTKEHIPHFETTNNWESAAKNASFAIIQLEDLLADSPSINIAESLSDDDGSVNGVAGFREDNLENAVPPDELSEQDDSASLSGQSSCCNEIRQEDAVDQQFFVANFAFTPNTSDFLEHIVDSESISEGGAASFEPEVFAEEAKQLRCIERPQASEQVQNAHLESLNLDSEVHLDDLYFGHGHPVVDEARHLSSMPRALNLDLINVLLRKDADDVTVDDVLQLENGLQFIQRTAKVVFILESKHPRIGRGYLRPMQDNNPNWALFSPTDHRLPRIRIPMREVPKDFLIHHEVYATILFIARIIKWDNPMFAMGCLEKPLGALGDIDAETKGILLEHGIFYEAFTSDILTSLPQTLPWKIPEEELSSRRDFRQQCIFTIDPSTARDLDDAVSCEPLGNGLYRVGVHIADVSYFVKQGTKLDSMATQRATSVYMVQTVIPMLPRLLCEQLCSLNPGEDRLTFSVEWTIREDGSILSEWFGRSVINTCAKLSYDHAQAMIEDPQREFAAGFLPQIFDRWTAKDISDRVLVLHTIAQRLRRKREERGSLRLDQIKLQFHLQEAGLPHGYSVYVQRDSNRLIEEFMLLANMAVARKIYKTFPKLAVLRLHPPPQDRGMNEVAECLESFGIHLDWTTAGNLQKSLNKYLGNDELSLARHQVITMMLAKPMNRALYFCSGALSSEENFWHYALNVPLYTHFTSPIRRYPDILVHRLLAASLDLDQELDTTLRYRDVANHCNEKKNMAKQVQDLSLEIFLGAFIRDFGPIEEEGMVCAVMDRSFDVLILKMGVVKRVYCEQMPLTKMEFISNDCIPRLNLVFDLNVPQNSPSNVVITIFTRVRVALTSIKENPLKFNIRKFSRWMGASTFDNLTIAFGHEFLSTGSH